MASGVAGNRPGHWAALAGNRRACGGQPASLRPSNLALMRVRPCGRTGSTYHEFPVSSPADFTPARVAAFADLMARLRPHGVLVHCGSGNRVGAMFALSHAREPGVTVDAALDYGRRAGLRTGAADRGAAQGRPLTVSVYCATRALSTFQRTALSTSPELNGPSGVCRLTDLPRRHLSRFPCRYGLGPSTA